MSKNNLNAKKTTSPIIINQTCLVSNNANNNIYRYQFPGSASFNDAKIAVANIQIFYSWQNINSQYNNNTLSLIFPTAATTATLNITIPAGTYSASDLNQYLQSQMILNNYYLIDASGNFVFFLEIVENAPRYSLQMNLYSVYTSTPSGWTNPGWTLPSTAYTPQIVIPATDIVTLLGFPAATYPPAQQTSTYSVLSSSVPQLSPVSSVIVQCNLINNALSNPRSAFYSFSPGGTTFGNMIQSNAYQYSWIDIVDGTYGSLDISFYDQNFNALQIQDTNLVIFLLIES